MQEKESKLLYLFCIPFNEQQKCHVTNIYTERKNKSIILHSFARKIKVSYYIPFFQTLLRTFSSDTCYSDRRIILSYCEKRKVTYYVCKKSNIFLWMNNKHRVTNCLHCRGKTEVSYYIIFREKQKYHITLCSSKLSWDANKMFLNGNAIADELLNIQFSLTTVQDTSLPGIQTHFINLSRIIGKPPWISIEKFGLSSKFRLYSFTDKW